MKLVHIERYGEVDNGHKTSLISERVSVWKKLGTFSFFLTSLLRNNTAPVSSVMKRRKSGESSVVIS